MTTKIRRRDFCASCEVEIEHPPVLHLEVAYCCIGCAEGGPCLCTYEPDLASDGVDGLGMPFAIPGPAILAPGPSHGAGREAAPVRRAVNDFNELLRSRS
jgi:hypothetical protein